MSSQEELDRAVRGLVGTRLTGIGRTANLVEIGLSGNDLEWTFHAPCPFRMTRGEEILVGSVDMAYPAKRDLDPDEAYRTFETKFDRKAKRLTVQLESAEYVVEAAFLGVAGLVRLTVLDSITIDLLPACAGPVEQWRLFARDTDMHFVYPDSADH
jgi:hypothetical protein